MAAIIILGGTIGVWSATAPIAGAVVSSGRLVVPQNRKQVQHPTGGVIGALHVREGSFVEKGQVLAELDATATQARLAVVEKKLDELHARSARLTAEQSGQTSLQFPQFLTERAEIEGVSEAIATENALFMSRKTAHGQRKDQMRERIGQIREEISGRTDVLKAKRDHEKITAKELAVLYKLKRRKLVKLDRLTSVERDAARIRAEIAENRTSIAQSRGRIAEIRIQMVSLDEEFRATAIKELREVQAEISRLNEQRVAAKDELKRVSIRAPISGQVMQLAVHTIGGVVREAEPLMEVVPLDENLEIEVPIAPQDFDQIHVGQTAEVKLQALNRRTLPELEGRVKFRPSDTVEDRQSGQRYYNVRLSLTPESLEKIKGVKLVAGMQADIFITTEARTFASYISRPIVEQMHRAFRER
ncbi:MAG: HlyD family type I secretion periplasmic adaptor subunit [Pseudomonadota bacterium]